MLLLVCCLPNANWLIFGNFSSRLRHFTFSTLFFTKQSLWNLISFYSGLKFNFYLLCFSFEVAAYLMARNIFLLSRNWRSWLGSLEVRLSDGNGWGLWYYQFFVNLNQKWVWVKNVLVIILAHHPAKSYISFIVSIRYFYSDVLQTYIVPDTNVKVFLCYDLRARNNPVG